MWYGLSTYLFAFFTNQKARVAHRSCVMYIYHRVPYIFLYTDVCLHDLKFRSAKSEYCWKITYLNHQEKCKFTSFLKYAFINEFTLISVMVKQTTIIKYDKIRYVLVITFNFLFYTNLISFKFLNRHFKQLCICNSDSAKR